MHALFRAQLRHTNPSLARFYPHSRAHHHQNGDLLRNGGRMHGQGFFLNIASNVSFNVYILLFFIFFTSSIERFSISMSSGGKSNINMGFCLRRILKNKTRSFFPHLNKPLCCKADNSNFKCFSEDSLQLVQCQTATWGGKFIGDCTHAPKGSFNGVSSSSCLSSDRPSQLEDIERKEK